MNNESKDLKMVAEHPNARQFVGSKMFNNLFAHGMELVEETATYLDNEGREASKNLDRAAALSYAGVSMRLTTRLMQIASWLLVLRAVREGEMSYNEASQPKYRLNDGEDTDAPPQRSSDYMAALPERLVELVQETNLIFDRLARIDMDLFVPSAQSIDPEGVVGQLDALKAAFPD